MNTADSFAQLITEAKDRAPVLADLGHAVDKFAALLMQTFPEKSGQDEFDLMGVHFKFFPSKEYSLSLEKEFQITDQNKCPNDLDAFAQHIQNGWLERISKTLENQNHLRRRTTNMLMSFCSELGG